MPVKAMIVFLISLSCKPACKSQSRFAGKHKSRILNSILAFQYKSYPRLQFYSQNVLNNV